MGLSDWYREHEQDDKADMYLWCWKKSRFPAFSPLGQYYRFQSIGLGHFEEVGEALGNGHQEGGIGADALEVGAVRGGWNQF